MKHRSKVLFLVSFAKINLKKSNFHSHDHFQTQYLDNIYFVNAKKPLKEIHSTLDECSTHLFYLTGSLFALYLFCAIEFCIYPVIVFVFTHTIEPALPVFIPFVDANTTDGYIITTTYHCLLLFIASVGLAFCDALFFNLVFNILTMSKLQCNQFTSLNKELEQPKQPIASITIRLINLFKMNQEMEQ